MADNKLLKSSMMVVFLTIVGKILAFVRDALVAAKFGASYATDIYMFSIGIIYLLTTISYGLTTTLIPIHTDIVEKYGKNNAKSFINNVINVSSLFTVAVTIILMIFAKDIVFAFAPGFKGWVFNECVYITKLMLISLIFISLQSVVTGVLQSYSKFLAPSSMACASNLVYIIYLVFLSKKYGIRGFAVAIVVGFLAQLVINLPQYKGLGYKYKPFIDFNDSNLKKLFILMIPVIISTSVVQLNLFVNRFFATTMYEGAVTTLDFANKINTIGYEVFGIAISMVVYPSLSLYAAKHNDKDYKIALKRAFNTLMLIMVPAAIGIAILRGPIVNVIFKRGAFSSKDASLTASALLFFSPAMVAYAVRDILNKAYYSVKDTKTPMINSFIGIGINIVLDLILMRTMKVAGLTFATSISVVIVTIILIMKLNSKLNGIDLEGIFSTFIKIAISSILMGIVVYFANKYILIRFGSEKLGSMLSIMVSFVLGAASYGILVRLFKVDEFVYAVNLVRKKFNKFG